MKRAVIALTSLGLVAFAACGHGSSPTATLSHASAPASPSPASSTSGSPNSVAPTEAPPSMIPVPAGFAVLKVGTVTLDHPSSWTTDNSAIDSRGRPIMQVIAPVQPNALPPVVAVTTAPHWVQDLASTITADRRGQQVAGSSPTLVSQTLLKLAGTIQAYRTVTTYLNPASAKAPATLVRDVNVEFITTDKTLVDVLLRGPDASWDSSALPAIEASVRAT